MKVIELVNKISNGEASDLKTYFLFEGERYNFYQFSKTFAIDINSLNWEVEIIKDKKIKPLFYAGNDIAIIGIKNKINEIIDKINAGVDKE